MRAVFASIALFVFGLIVSACGGGGGSKGGPGMVSPVRVAQDTTGMIEIPAGKFFMGNDQGTGDPDEWPKAEVTMKNSFFMDAHEVSVAEFSEYARAGSVQTAAERTGGETFDVTSKSWAVVKSANYKKPDGASAANPDWPVVHVGWEDAYFYCNAKGKRLPTEAEWEYAAGAGQGLMYANGNDFVPDEYCFNFNTPDLFCNVESKNPNGFGLYHMIGNVHEWTSTLFDGFKYPYDPTDGREDQIADGTRVRRGGSAFNDHVESMRVQNRGTKDGNIPNENTGFRCAG